MKLSAIIIAKNSQDQIEDALRSVAFCTEIIVVDAQSIDKTVSIAKRRGAKVIKGDLLDFAKQREIGMKHAQGEWLLYIDTDERVSPQLKQNILHHIEQSKYNAYRLKRQNFYLGNHPWPKIEKLERLFRKDSLEGWVGKLHETAKIKGEVGEMDGYLLHYTHRSLEEMLAKTIVWSEVEAKLRFDSGHPKMTWWRFPRVMFTAFWNSYVRQGGWKIGTIGLIESIYQAFSMFITYARLWEMQQKY